VTVLAIGWLVPANVSLLPDLKCLAAPVPKIRLGSKIYKKEWLEVTQDHCK